MVVSRLTRMIITETSCRMKTASRPASPMILATSHRKVMPNLITEDSSLPLLYSRAALFDASEPWLPQKDAASLACSPPAASSPSMPSPSFFLNCGLNSTCSATISFCDRGLPSASVQRSCLTLPTTRTPRPSYNDSP